jgi:hypothetical protein
MAEYHAKLEEEVVAEYRFTINEIPITLKRTSENTRRYVNGHMINKIEVEEVAFQASCYDDAELYEKFVKSVSKMSLKWHKALAYGVPVKINAGLSYDDYHRAEAPMACPRIKFVKEEDDFKLVVGENQSVKIKFNECLTKLKTLNRQTNNNYAPGSYNQKNNLWAQRQLVDILKQCCTFDKKEVKTVEVEEPQFDDKGVLVVNDKGEPIYKKVKKKEVTVTKECTLTDEQAKFVGKMAEEFHKKALEKSEIALKNAIKNTGATVVQFKGEDHYRVEGKLRKYVVNKRTNEVFNHDTGNYVCIVEPGHQIMVGFDALATRLYALKNDSVMAAKVGTLR